MRKTSMTAVVSVIVSITALMVPILIGMDNTFAVDVPAETAPDTAANTVTYTFPARSAGSSGPSSILFSSSGRTFTDERDGQVYRIVQVGGQVWMAENLNFAAEGSACYENSEDSCAKYGRLYNWETSLNACPAGWRLPADKEWTTLVDYAGGEKTAGIKLKSTNGWNDYNGESGNGTNEYDFSALPGGLGSSWGNYGDAGYYGIWWSATEYSAWNAWYRGTYYHEYVFRYDNPKINLHSVRCVQDN